MTKQQLVLIHPIDPRGEKVGGIETHVRLLMARHPDDVSVLLIGVDGRGDLTPGEVVKVQGGTREIEFLPVMAFHDDTAKHAASQAYPVFDLPFHAGPVAPFSSNLQAGPSHAFECRFATLRICDLCQGPAHPHSAGGAWRGA